jgi:hypothetical protein
MGSRKRRSAAIAAIVVVACSALAFSLAPASAFDPNGNVYWFDYNVDATAHMKTLDQTMEIKGGRFQGGIDFGTGELRGTMALPPATFTFTVGGVLPVLTATAKVIPTKPVTGMVDLNYFTVTATSVFNVKLVSAYAVGTTAPNLVGTKCMTAYPASVTMSGAASLGEASTFTGEFTMPPFKDCGKKTDVLNLLLAGPGNTFSATATPRG